MWRQSVSQPSATLTAYHIFDIINSVHWCLFSFDARSGVSQEATRSRIPDIDINGVNELEDSAAAADCCHAGSGLALQAFPHRRESFLYRYPFGGDGDLIPKSLTRKLCANNEPPSVNRTIAFVQKYFTIAVSVSIRLKLELFRWHKYETIAQSIQIYRWTMH